MTTQSITPNRWRPRFSVRTLVVMVTLVCVYFGCWEITKRFGVRDIVFHKYVFRKLNNKEEVRFAGFLSSPGPFVVSQKWTGNDETYYFWFFGYIAKLPYEREP